MKRISLFENFLEDGLPQELQEHLVIVIGSYRGLLDPTYTRNMTENSRGVMLYPNLDVYMLRNIDPSDLLRVMSTLNQKNNCYDLDYFDYDLDSKRKGKDLRVASASIKDLHKDGSQEKLYPIKDLIFDMDPASLIAGTFRVFVTTMEADEAQMSFEVMIDQCVNLEDLEKLDSSLLSLVPAADLINFKLKTGQKRRVDFNVEDLDFKPLPQTMITDIIIEEGHAINLIKANL